MTWDDAEIPEGWAISPLADVIRPSRLKIDPALVPGTPYIGLEHVEAHTTRLLSRGTAADVKSAKSVFKAGDVLYGKLRPYLNKVVRPDFDGVCSTDFLVFGESEHIERSYLAHYLNQLWVADRAHHLSAGVELPRVDWGSLSTIPISYPRSKEIQCVIVAGIEATIAKGRSSAEHLASAWRTIERFRQAVLAAACSGRLTADWRDGHNQLPGVSEVLAELRTNRLGRAKQSISIEPFATDELDSIPETWGWAAVGEIAEVQLGGTPARKTAAFWNAGVPWVSSGEVANCRISHTRETISEQGLTNSSAKLYPAGTVLIAMIGEGKTRGQSAILDIEASTNQNVAGLLLNRNLVNPEYVWRWALAQYEVTRAVGRGGNQPALNGQKVRELLIPVPPLDEQNEIVRRVDNLLATVDGLQIRIDTARRRVDQSTQAVLAKAFRGELVGPLEEVAETVPN